MDTPVHCLHFGEHIRAAEQAVDREFDTKKDQEKERYIAGLVGAAADTAVGAGQGPWEKYSNRRIQLSTLMIRRMNHATFFVFVWFFCVRIDSTARTGIVPSDADVLRL